MAACRATRRHKRQQQAGTHAQPHTQPHAPPPHRPNNLLVGLSSHADDLAQVVMPLRQPIRLADLNLQPAHMHAGVRNAAVTWHVAQCACASRVGLCACAAQPHLEDLHALHVRCEAREALAPAAAQAHQQRMAACTGADSDQQPPGRHQHKQRARRPPTHAHAECSDLGRAPGDVMILLMRATCSSANWNSTSC